MTFAYESSPCITETNLANIRKWLHMHISISIYLPVYVTWSLFWNKFFSIPYNLFSTSIQYILATQYTVYYWPFTLRLHSWLGSVVCYATQPHKRMWCHMSLAQKKIKIQDWSIFLVVLLFEVKVLCLLGSSIWAMSPILRFKIWFLLGPYCFSIIVK
jgi:hypothetical protein